MSIYTIRQDEIGPCLHCRRPLHLVASDSAESPCFFNLPFWITRKDRASEDQLSCHHCGFTTDFFSYKAMQNQTMAGLITNTFDTASTTDISALSVPSGLPKESVDRESSKREEYESLNGLLIAEKYYSEACRSCRASLARNWRFCPNCGIYIEEESSSSTESSSQRSGDSEVFHTGHLLIDRPLSS